MSTDDEFARSLRDHADAAVPPMEVDAATTLHLGRRKVRTRHAWQVGSVVAAVGVVAVAVAPILPTMMHGTGRVGTSTSAPSTTPAGDAAMRAAKDAALASVLDAKKAILEHDISVARARPFDVSTWDGLSSRLDALVTEAEAIPGYVTQARVVELGLFAFPTSYTARSTAWIGWDAGDRITVAEDRTTDRLRIAFGGEPPTTADALLPARGRGTLSLVDAPSGRALDGTVLTYEDEDGSRFQLDVVQRAWKVTPTAAADLATSSPGNTPTAPSSDATGAPGHTVDVTAAERAQLESLSTTAMSGATAPARATAAENLENLTVSIARTRHVTAVVDGDRDVVPAGLVPTQDNPTPAVMFVATKHAQWDGWIDGYGAIVTAGAAGDGDLGSTTTTGELRVVLIGLDTWDGYGRPFTIKGTGALTIESDAQGVLTLRDAHGATHRFDLAAMRWA
jgi:hypothetical protein